MVANEIRQVEIVDITVDLVAFLQGNKIEMEENLEFPEDVKRKGKI